MKPQGFTEGYLLYLMAHASAAASDAFHAEIARDGVSVTTWRILGSLYPDRQLNVGTLARMSLLKQPTLTRQLDRLCADGVTMRHHAKDDRRGVLVELTDKGRGLARGLIDRAQAHEAGILEGFSAEEVTDLKARLKSLIDRAGD